MIDFLIEKFHDHALHGDAAGRDRRDRDRPTRWSCRCSPAKVSASA